jgi:hypothetical protein
MPLPNFLVIGAAKAGTTSLYHYLRAHPDIYMSPIKEPRYFSRDIPGTTRAPIRTRRAYEKLFAAVTTQHAIGEASPQYLYSIEAPSRIGEELGEPKLIVSLRNPADRAYSSYLGRVRSGDELGGVEEAMRPGTYYFETSLYYPKLRRYFDRFDRSKIKVILFDDLIAETHSVMRALYEFLDVDPSFEEFAPVRHNKAEVPRSLWMNFIVCQATKAWRTIVPDSFPGFGLSARAQRMLVVAPPPLSPEIRRRMLEEFREDIERTSALIDIDLTRWVT